MSYGMDARIGIGFQTAFGTPASVSSIHWLEPTGESVELKKAQNIQQGMRGIYDEGRHQEGANTVEGDVSIEAKPIPLGVLLKCAMGQPITVTSGAVRTHTFKPRTSDFSSLSAEVPFTYVKGMGDAGSMHLYSDMNAASMELSIANGELLTAQISVVGGTYSQVGSVAATYIAGNALDWSVSSVSLGGTAKSTVRDLTVSLDNALEAKHTLSTSKSPQRNKRSGFRTFEISGTMLFDDQVDYQTFIAQTEGQLRVHIKGTTLIQSGYNESLTLDSPTFRYTEFGQAVGGPGEIEVGFTGKAIYSTTSATALAITLVNTQTAY